MSGVVSGGLVLPGVLVVVRVDGTGCALLAVEDVVVRWLSTVVAGERDVFAAVVGVVDCSSVPGALVEGVSRRVPVLVDCDVVGDVSCGLTRRHPQLRIERVSNKVSTTVWYTCFSARAKIVRITQCTFTKSYIVQLLVTNAACGVMVKASTHRVEQPSASVS